MNIQRWHVPQEARLAKLEAESQEQAEAEAEAEANRLKFSKGRKPLAPKQRTTMPGSIRTPPIASPTGAKPAPSPKGTSSDGTRREAAARPEKAEAQRWAPKRTPPKAAERPPPSANPQGGLVEGGETPDRPESRSSQEEREEEPRACYEPRRFGPSRDWQEPVERPEEGQVEAEAAVPEGQEWYEGTVNEDWTAEPQEKSTIFF
eukprot:g20198.t1